MSQKGITLLGLGPGDIDLITLQAWRTLESIPEIYLRTTQHPSVGSFPKHLKVYSFDEFYKTKNSFEDVYEAIIEKILLLGRRSQGVVYAVPGHPFVAESTSPEIARRANEAGLPVVIVEGLSFLEPTFTALGIDPLPHTAIVDALELSSRYFPPYPPDVPALIAQIYSRDIATEVKLILMEVYPDEYFVKLVHAVGTSHSYVEEVPLHAIDKSEKIGLLSTLYIPPLGAGVSLESFQEVIAHLRAPEGCPWDREQSHKSLRNNLLEESYEVLEAIDTDNPQSLLEELGDLLLQIVLHAQIASEEGEFKMADIIQGIHQKLLRRHPHVFGETQVNGVPGVLENWEKLKAQERAENREDQHSSLDGVPLTLPALAQAEQYINRAARLGFEWPDLDSVIHKVKEEFKEACQASTQDECYEEIGDLFFTIVNLARWYNIDAESALRAASARFRKRFNYVERITRAKGKNISDLPLFELLEIWQETKHMIKDE